MGQLLLYRQLITLIIKIETNMQTFSEEVKSEISKLIIQNKYSDIVFYAILKSIGEFNLDKNVCEIITIYPSVIRFLREYCDQNSFTTEIFYSKQTTLRLKRRNYLIKINLINPFEERINLSNNLQKNSKYLTGMFLAIGSVSNPEKSSHLEFRCSSLAEQKMIIKSFKLFQLSPKTIIYKNKFVVYFKKHQEISDVLKILGANNSMFRIEERKIENDLVNNYQRLINLEVSNLKKIAAANIQQINICSAIKSSIYFDSLNEREKIYCLVRIDYQEASMQTICELMNEKLPSNKKITKGSLSHIVTKMKKIYNELI